MHKRLLDITFLMRAVSRAFAFYQGSPALAIRRVFRVWRREGIDGVRRRAQILMGGLKSGGASSLDTSEIYGHSRQVAPDWNPKISVIVPNYNHARFLRHRLESIFKQTYKNIEVILLDDGSTDESREIILEFARTYPEKTICKFNDLNSGSVFKQWKAGIQISSGELVWIAESDDFCDENFLSEQVNAFQNPAVMLSFCRTDFVSGDPVETTWTIDQYLADLDIVDWGRPFIRSTHALVDAGWGIKNIVPNVSSALFRNPRALPLFDDPRWLGLRMCGDWVFYLAIARGGLVAYTPFTTNYYRQHDRGTSKITQKADRYYVEHEIVASYLVQLYRIDRSILDKQDKLLYLHWCNQRGGDRRAEYRSLYDPIRAWNNGIHIRLPNIAMAVYALAAGGGETFPIFLANLLYERGYAVTLLNCSQQATEPGVLALIDSRIPRLELSRLELAGLALSDLGIDIVHSHHAWVDLTLANLLIGDRVIKQVVTMHGMYEMMTSEQLNALIPLLTTRIDHFVFTAEKNVACFPEVFRKSKRFSKIPNALAVMRVNPVDLRSLGIEPNDFVLCMVARAIPEKGWDEAIQAVKLANKSSLRKIHLLLIGDGPEFNRLIGAESSDRIHFLGFRQNIRDYFAASDIGFLPSRFKGESAPLVVIDCLLAGKPVLASDIGEIRQMLSSPDGLAGELVSLNDWSLDSDVLCEAIVALADHSERYRHLCACVESASEKFSVSAMADSYESVYSACISGVDPEDGRLSRCCEEEQIC